jgi:two-component system chemotaxis response regulator CheB
MGSLLTSWVENLADPEEAEDPSTVPGTMEVEVFMADVDPDAVHDVDRPGDPAGFGCPDCGGALYQIDESGLRRFRCRVGHAWSPESLLARQTVAMESALWMALRSLQEKAALNTELAERAGEHGQGRTARRFGANAEEALRAAELVRQLIDDLSSRVDQQAGQTEAG